MISVLCGDALTTLKTLPSESVQCVVTSPPYYGLRDYGVEGQLGLEETPQLYVEKLVDIFREVKRVLRSDGTCWLNLGDSYTSAGGGGEARMIDLGKPSKGTFRQGNIEHGRSGKRPYQSANLKPKDLIGIPWRVAFALQEDGWWLRQDIIWSKDNPMPESVTDRCTKSHEYVFLLTKSARYFYDAEAVKEPCSDATINDGRTKRGTRGMQGVYYAIDGNCGYDPSGRNLRSVWTINTHSYAGSHFATMPPKLAETCIMAGTSQAGCCSECGKPWERVVEIESHPNIKKAGQKHDGTYYRPNPGGGVSTDTRNKRHCGFRTTCSCNAPSQSCTVLDPFGGSGTTGEAAQRLGRNAILIELNPDYLPLIYKRTRQSALALCA